MIKMEPKIKKLYRDQKEYREARLNIIVKICEDKIRGARQRYCKDGKVLFQTAYACPLVPRRIGNETVYMHDVEEELQSLETTVGLLLFDEDRMTKPLNRTEKNILNKFSDLIYAAYRYGYLAEKKDVDYFLRNGTVPIQLV